MAHRTIQVVLDDTTDFDSGKRFWKLALFNEDGTPFSGGEGGGSVGEWVTPTLLNGWADSETNPFQYRLEQGGKVLRFRGLLIGTGRTGTKVCDLPEGVIIEVGQDRTFGVTTWMSGGPGYRSNEGGLTSTGVHVHSVDTNVYMDLSVGLD
jgi:hypothetical protein